MNKSQKNRRRLRKNKTQKGGYDRTFMYVHKATALDYKDNMGGSISAPIPASDYNSRIATRGGKRILRRSQKKLNKNMKQK